MPTLDEIRAKGEAGLAQLLASLDERHKRRLLAAIQQYGRVQDIPESFWQEMQSETESETAAALYLLMLDADSWTSREIRLQGGRVSRTSPANAAEYALTAAQRARDFATSRVATTRDRLTRSVEDALLDRNRGDVGEFTVDGLDEALEKALDKSRQEGAAIDGTTQALSDGQRGAAGRAGTRLTMLWITEGDERVCPRCSPLHEQPEEVWSKVFPEGPGWTCHPRCRCHLRPILLSDEPPG